MKTIKYFAIIALLLFAHSRVNADYFAYVPDISANQSQKLVHIYNTTLKRKVKSLVILGDPQDVLVSHSGKFVFVSAIINDGVLIQPVINVVNAFTNSLNLSNVVRIDGTFVRGMALSKDENKLFVIHDDTISIINGPGFANSVTKTDLSLTYNGMKAIITDDDKYLFIVGKDTAENDGISVVEVSSMTEIRHYPIGTGKGASEIVFDNINKRLFVALSQSNEVVAVRIENYNNAQALSLDTYQTRNLPFNSSPADIHLYKNNTELLVSLSYIKNQLGTGDGNILILKTDDISANNISNDFTIFLSKENSAYTLEGGAIHPRAVNVDDQGIIHVLKQIWSDTNGLYLVKLKDSTNTTTGERTISEFESFNLGGQVSTLANGRFIGPDCKECPKGEGQPEVKIGERPASLSFLIILVLFSTLVLTRQLRSRI